jgi:hypothetical protein
MGFLILALMTLGVLVAGVVGMGLMLVRLVFWAVFLPLRLAFGLVFGILLFPLWILRGAFKVASLAIVIPIMLVGGLLAGAGLLIAALAAVVVPLLPVLVLGLIVYGLFRAFTRRPAVVRSY